MAHRKTRPGYLLLTVGCARGLGILDPNGYLVITGRLKEQFKLQNGRYVAPTPIEEHLKLSPLIANCVLYGADRPFCVLVVSTGQACVEDEARQHGLTLSSGTEDRSCTT